MNYGNIHQPPPQKKMEKRPEPASPKKMKNNILCIPRLRSNSCTSKINKGRLSPMTLLERFREAVFRLIMLSALSKATNHSTTGSSPTDYAAQRFHYPNLNDPHHSEAVADCIEFIKKKASTDDQNRDSTASSSSSIHATASYVIH